MTKCWEWGGPTRNGYGYVYLAGHYLYAHRYIWCLLNGPIPEGMQVLHHCDNPICIRLDHLFLGTQADNIHDMIAKGRHYQQKKTHCPQGHLYQSYGWRRYCRICATEQSRESKERIRI